jgi:hypothetical protein
MICGRLATFPTSSEASNFRVRLSKTREGLVFTTTATQDRKIWSTRCRCYTPLFFLSLTSRLIKHLYSGLYYKSFTIIIYYCNDRGQYYKTKITVIIYDLA